MSAFSALPASPCGCPTPGSPRSCRTTPAGLSPRSKFRSPFRDPVASSTGKLPPRKTRHVFSNRSRYSCRDLAAGAIKTAIASVWLRQAGIAGRRHDRGQRTHALGIADGDFLRDHAAHRGADDMGGGNAERIHQARRRRRPCRSKLVRRGDRHAQKAQFEDFAKRRGPAARHAAGFSDVAIVEADDAKSARGEFADRIRRANGSSARQPHDQHDRLRVRRAEDFVAELDAIGPDDLRRLMERMVQCGLSFRVQDHGACFIA